MGRKFDYDYIVLGSGAAGNAAARVAASAGLKVALIENKKYGGAGLNTYSVPYTVGMNFAHNYAKAKDNLKLGLSSVNLRYNYPTAMRWREATIRRVREATKQHLSGVDYIRGFGHFVGDHEIAVSQEKTLTGAKFLIATGTELAENGISGLDKVQYLTQDNALDLEKPPQVVFVAGAGRAGCEIAQYYAELGSKVLIADIAARLLPKEDEEVGQVLDYYFNRKLGIKVLTQSRVVMLEEDKISKKVIFLRGGQEKSVRVNAIILATGVKPNFDLGLENAKVKFNQNGIIVDKNLQTNIKHVWAAGDVVKRSDLLRRQSSIELASYEGALAAMNMLKRKKTPVNYAGFVEVINTAPKIASVGMTEDDCIKRDRKYRKVVMPLAATNRAKIEDFYDGFVKILVNSQNSILGATVMAPEADLIIQEVAMAIKHELTLRQLAETPHPALSWSELIKVTAQKIN